MNAATLAQLFITLGPVAFELIPRLAAIWHKPDLSLDEVVDICKTARKTYDQYIVEARTRLAGVNPPTQVETHTGDAS